MNQRSKMLVGVLFGLIILLIAVSQIRWSSLDSRPLAWDEAIHTLNALSYNENFPQKGFSAYLHPAYFRYPPLYHAFLGLFLASGLEATDAASFLNFFFLAGLVLVVFELGRVLLGPVEGLLASFFVGSFPVFVELSRFALIDLSLTFWVSLTLLCLIKSNNFESWTWSLLFGVGASLAMLTKWTAFIYILGPFIWVVFRLREVKRYLRLLTALGVGILMAGPWYLYNLIPSLIMISRSSVNLPDGTAMNGFWRLAAYPLSLGHGLNLLYLVLFLIGLSQIKKQKNLWLLLSGLIVSMMVLSFMINQQIRYLAPSLPVIALVMASLWMSLPSKLVKTIVIGSSLACFFFIHFGPAYALSIPVGPRHFLLMGTVPPIREDWKHREIIQAVEENRPDGSAFVRTVVMANSAFVHGKTLDVSARLLGFPDLAFSGPKKRHWMNLNDFILFKSENLGPENTLGDFQAALKDITPSPGWFDKSYREVSRWDLPDGTQAILYKADPKPLVPLGLPNLSLTLRTFKLPNITMEDVTIQASPLSYADTARGRFREIVLRCRSLLFKGIPFKDITLRLLEPQINLPRFFERSDLQLIQMSGLAPRATVDLNYLYTYLMEKAPWLKDPQVEFGDDQIVVSGVAKGFPFKIHISIKKIGSNLETRLEKFQLGGIPLPRWLLASLVDQSVSLKATRDRPFALHLESMGGDSSSLWIR